MTNLHNILIKKVFLQINYCIRNAHSEQDRKNIIKNENPIFLSPSKLRLCEASDYDRLSMNKK